jgi:hypothetical protein
MTTDDDKIARRWRQARLKSPGFLPALAELCMEAKRRGYPRWSIGAAFEILRWKSGHHDGGELGFKLDNNHRALAARDLMEEYPELDGFLKTRERKPRHDNWGHVS